MQLHVDAYHSAMLLFQIPMLLLPAILCKYIINIADNFRANKYVICMQLACNCMQKKKQLHANVFYKNYFCMHMCMHMHAHVHAYACIGMLMCMHRHTYVCTYACICMPMHAYVHAYACQKKLKKNAKLPQ